MDLDLSLLSAMTVSPAIVILCYCIAEILKSYAFKNKDGRNMIPIFCALIGGVVATLIFFFYPQGISSANAMEAFATGGFSGILATGCNQIFKRVSNFNNNKQ